MAKKGKLYNINLSAHSMRKTFAYTVWLSNEKDIVLVNELLGHATIRDTKRYLGLDTELYNSKTTGAINDNVF